MNLISCILLAHALRIARIETLTAIIEANENDLTWVGFCNGVYIGRCVHNDIWCSAIKERSALRREEELFWKYSCSPEGGDIPWPDPEF